MEIPVLVLAFFDHIGRDSQIGQMFDYLLRLIIRAFLFDRNSIGLFSETFSISKHPANTPKTKPAQIICRIPRNAVLQPAAKVIFLESSKMLFDIFTTQKRKKKKQIVKIF